MRWGLAHIFILLLGVLACSCRQKEEKSMILGSWQVVEYWSDGSKMELERMIRFYSDGTYNTFENEGDTISGEWRIRHEVLVLYQPELKDMHGNRIMEPFTRAWKTVISEEWMLLEGTSRSNTAGMQLILRRKE